MPLSAPLLEVDGLSKSFPGIRALDDVSMRVGPGEIVALVGQNGSGKSTLVKILARVYTPDPGATIRVAGEGSSNQTQLRFIHQDLGLIAGLSTIENLDLDRKLGRRMLLPAPRRREQRAAEALIGRFHASFDVRRPIGELSAAERTIVALSRALRDLEHDRNVLVLDEPTASLHRDEVRRLFVSVRRMAEQGAGVVFISHRLEEVTDLADRIVVLRDGRVVADVARDEVDHDRLARLIAGKLAGRASAQSARTASHVVLRARGLHSPLVRSIDLDLNAGEIVGVSGVLGSGREQIASALFGASAGRVDELDVEGVHIRRPTPARAIRARVAFVPAERHRQGSVMEMSVRENMTLPGLSTLRTPYGSLDRRAEAVEVARWIHKVGVKPPVPERSLKLFSGGNQQKVVLAKWMRNEPKVLLMDEPTQGVDVGAKAAIYDLIAAVAARGAAVLIASSDTKELAALCDRVIVMRDGELSAELASPELSEAALVAAELG